MKIEDLGEDIFHGHTIHKWQKSFSKSCLLPLKRVLFWLHNRKKCSCGPHGCPASPELVLHCRGGRRGWYSFPDLSPPLGPPAGQVHSPVCLIPVVQLILAEKLQMFVVCNLQVLMKAEVCGQDALRCYRYESLSWEGKPCRSWGGSVWGGWTQSLQCLLLRVWGQGRYRRPQSSQRGLSFSSWVGRAFLEIKWQLHSGFRTGLHSAVVKAQVSFTCACFLTC